MRYWTGMIVVSGLPLLLAACGDSSVMSGRPVASYTEAEMPVPGAAAGYSRLGQFVARLQQPATTNGAVTNARMDEQGNLTVTLNPNLKAAEVRPLVTNLMQQMRTTFPDQALTVIATGPNGKKLASLHYDPMQPGARSLAYQQYFQTGKG